MIKLAIRRDREKRVNQVYSRC